MKTRVLLLCAVVIVSCVCISVAQNNRPIIGVYTQPAGSDLLKYGSQYIAASYVKYIESAGARVVPVKYSITPDEVETLFKSLNGFLLPGGGVDFGTQHQYWQTLSLFFQYANQANQAGDYFPIWGTCMGFQELCLLESQNMSLLTQFDTENYTVPLDFTPVAPSSKMFSSAPSNIYNTLGTQPVTMNNHMWGVSPASWNANKYLANYYNVLSTNVDREGLVFISTIEGKSMPIYGSQWHPEKVLFEWNIHEVMNHSTESILANQYVANFFVAECRKSNHAFSSVANETAALIYNYQPVYTYPIENDFEQTYFFND